MDMRLSAAEITRRIACLIRSNTGAISPMMALFLIPLIAVIGLAVETSNWFYTARSMQNAADSAALAVAASSCTAVAVCQTNAQAMTRQYGFVGGASDVTVIATANTAPCPTGGVSNCYKVSLSKKVPFYLVKIVGFAGDATTSSGASGQTVTVSATARPKTPGAGYCVMALAHGMSSGSSAFTVKGGSKMDLPTCDVLTNASSRCTGQSGNAIGSMEYVGGAGSCGVSETQVASISDPYAPLSAANIPANTCGSYPGASLTQTNLTANDAAHPKIYCGTLTLLNNVTLTTASPGSVIIIENGSLNTNGYKLTVPVGSGLTIVFSGSPSMSPGFVTGSGALDYSAPSSGPWSGIALYQDARLTTHTYQSYAGANPTFNITGLIYLPYVDLSISGAINYKTGGTPCIGLVVDQLDVNGTGATLQHPPSQSATADCLVQAGLVLPTSPGSSTRPALVQ